MRIGIDIDDTTTDTWNYMIPIFIETFQKTEAELRTCLPYYEAVKDKVASLEEYFRISVPLFEDNFKKLPLKNNAKEVINRLKDDGHEIIFITARGAHDHIDNIKENKLTKEYFFNHKINYDKLISGVNRKDVCCQKEQIDLFIDDSTIHCKEVASLGIDVLLFENHYNAFDTEFTHIKSWLEIEKYVLSKAEKITSG